MDKVLPYLLLLLLACLTWNDSLSGRIRNVIGTPNAASENSGSKSRPFWQQQGYKTVLERGDDDLQKKQQVKNAQRNREQ